MTTERNTTEFDAELFDPEHDMDLVLLLNDAQTHDDVQEVIRISRNRMRVRRVALGAAQPRRGFTAARLRKLTPGLPSRD